MAFLQNDAEEAGAPGAMPLPQRHEFVVEGLLGVLTGCRSWSLGRGQSVSALLAQAPEQMADRAHGQADSQGDLGG
jgi:hypothetical protein